MEGVASVVSTCRFLVLWIVLYPAVQIENSATFRVRRVHPALQPLHNCSSVFKSSAVQKSWLCRRNAVLRGRERGGEGEEVGGRGWEREEVETRKKEPKRYDT